MTFSIDDPGSGFATGFTDETLVPDQEMPYLEQMKPFAQAGLGFLKGIVDGVPHSVMSVASSVWQGATLEGLLETDMDIDKAYQTATGSTSGWWDGEILPYDNTAQRVGGFGGEFASPFAYGKVFQVLGGVSRLWNVGEQLISVPESGLTVKPYSTDPLSPDLDLDVNTRGVGGADGQPYAKSILDGGTGTAYAGHGYRFPGSISGWTTVPDGTYLTLPRDGIFIGEETGQTWNEEIGKGLRRPQNRMWESKKTFRAWPRICLAQKFEITR